TRRSSDLLAVTELRLSEQCAGAAAAFEAIARVRPHLFAADVELHRPVDDPGRVRGLRPVAAAGGARAQRRGFAQPDRLQILAHPFAPALSAEPALPVPPEAAGGVGHVGAVHPHAARLDVWWQLQLCIA